MKAYVFPGQGAQFAGMGKDLYDSKPLAKELFDKANEILGYSITDIMFNGTDEQLKETKITQIIPVRLQIIPVQSTIRCSYISSSQSGKLPRIKR